MRAGKKERARPGGHAVCNPGARPPGQAIREAGGLGWRPRRNLASRPGRLQALPGGGGLCPGPAGVAVCLGAVHPGAGSTKQSFLPPDGNEVC